MEGELKNYSRYQGGNECGLGGRQQETVIEDILARYCNLCLVQKKIKVEQEDETREWENFKNQTDAFGLDLQTRGALLNLEIDEI